MGSPLPAPTARQQHLIDIVGRVFIEHQQFPGWVYVEEQMERLQLDAAAVLATLPRDTHNYGHVWPMRQSPPFRRIVWG